jgi:predicted transcriptional regulator
VAEPLSPRRREIVDYLTVNGETSLTDLTESLNRSRNNVCHDLRFLLAMRLVSRRYEGQQAFYSAVSD